MSPRATNPNAIAMLMEDHKKVRGLLSRLDKTTERAAETRKELLERIAQEIKIHTTIEEEIFYPAYREAVSRREDSKLYQEALEEHHVADTVLTELNASEPESEQFSAKAKVLKDVIEHHAEEEEKQMFPRARKAMDVSELAELGGRMLERKHELEASYEGWLPAAGKLLASVASRVAGNSPRSRSASVAARGATPKRRAAKRTTSRAKKSKATPARARAKSRKK